MLWAILARGLRNLTRTSLSYAPCLRAAYATLRAPAFRLTSFSFLRARLRAAYATFRQPWFSNHACSGAYAQLSLSLRSPCAKSALMQKCLRRACAPLARPSAHHALNKCMPLLAYAEVIVSQIKIGGGRSGNTPPMPLPRLGPGRVIFKMNPPG